MNEKRTYLSLEAKSSFCLFPDFLNGLPLRSLFLPGLLTDPSA